MFKKTATNSIQKMEVVTIFYRGKFRMMYLGCPIGYAKEKKQDLAECIKKVQNKLNVWKDFYCNSGKLSE